MALGRLPGASREFPLPKLAQMLADSPRANCESWRVTLLRLVLVRIARVHREPMICHHFHQSGLDLVRAHVLELARRTDFLTVDNWTGVGNQAAQQPDEHAKDRFGEFYRIVFRYGPKQKTSFRTERDPR